MYNEIITSSVANASIRILDAEKTVNKEQMCDWHFHNEFELFFLYEGTKIFYSNNKVFEMKKGDIVFVNRRIPHKTITPIGSRGILIQFNSSFYFDEVDLDEYIFLPIRNNEDDIWFFPANTDINRQLYVCIKKISQEYLNKDNFYNMYIKSCLYEILACLCRHNIIAINKPTNKKLISDILPVLEHINKNYSQHMSLDDVCGLIHLEKSYFCKLFKKAIKVSFLDYLNYIRIYHAEILLQKTNKTVTEISLEVGFSSSSYFAEIFKKVNSLSPTAYRKMISYSNS